MEVPVGQEAELERCDGTLDGHVGDIDDDPASIESCQRGPERARTFGCVEGEHLVHPPWSGQARRHLGNEGRAGGDDENVVTEQRPIGEVHLVRRDIDAVDLRLTEPDVAAELTLAGSYDVLAVRESERNEQQARLVDVAVVLIDDRQRHFVDWKEPAEAVGDERPTRSAAQNHYTCAHAFIGHQRYPPG